MTQIAERRRDGAHERVVLGVEGRERAELANTGWQGSAQRIIVEPNPASRSEVCELCWQGPRETVAAQREVTVQEREAAKLGGDGSTETIVVHVELFEPRKQANLRRHGAREIVCVENHALQCAQLK